MLLSVKRSLQNGVGNMDLKKKHFEIPTLATYGTLSELTEAHSEKIKTHGHGWAWGHYNDDDHYKGHVSVAS